MARSATSALFLPIALIVGLTACRATPQPAPPAAKPVVLGPDEPTNALPADFDIPSYPGAVVEHVRRPKGVMREILMHTDAPLESLIAFYRTHLPRAGFQITSVVGVAARRAWSCDFHKAGQQASVMLYPSDKDPARMTIDLLYEIPSREPHRPLIAEEKFDVVGPGEIAQGASNSNSKNN